MLRSFAFLLLTIAVIRVQLSAAFTPAQITTSTTTTRTRVSPLFASSNDTGLDKTLREELKVQLLASADEFKSIQSDLTNAVIYEKKMEDDADGKKPKERGYYFKLLKRIIGKIMGKKPKKTRSTYDRSLSLLRGLSQFGSLTFSHSNQCITGILGTDSFGTLKLEVGEAGNKTIAIAEELAKLNPTPNPTYGWMGYGGGSPEECGLQGKWKLKFTTAADATFPENPNRGKAMTSQEIDATAGTLTNVVDFEKGKTLGFRVVVAGKAVSDKEIELTFKRVVIFRDSRFFKKIVFPIPTRLFRLINRISARGKASKRGPYFELQYLDENLRMHKTGEGNWFIQSRLE